MAFTERPLTGKQRTAPALTLTLPERPGSGWPIALPPPAATQVLPSDTHDCDQHANGDAEGQGIEYGTDVHGPILRV
jgi:hypothetical protein